MPLRNRLRRAFTRGSHDDPTKPKPDPNVYQPGEKMPPLKYKRIPAPEHTAHLESFTWAKAWRRRSNHSVYSPMGSRMVSRKSSFASFSSRSRRSRSLHRKSMSRGRDGIDSGVGGSFAGDVPEQVIEDSDDEGDVLNVGLSRNPTQDPRREQREQREQQQRERASSITSTSRPPTSTATRNDTPFNAADLELALKKSHLEVPKEESPGHSEEASPQSPGIGLRPREALAV